MDSSSIKIKLVPAARRRGGASGKSTESSGMIEELTTMLSPFHDGHVVSFRCLQSSEAGYTKNPGEDALGDFCDFKLKEMTADSRTL